MDGLRREVEDLRQRSQDQQRRLTQLEARCGTSHVVAQRRECYYCHQRGHVRRECAALRAQRNNAGHETRWKQNFHSLRALLPRRNSGNASETAILQQASEYIRSLEQEKKRLQNAEMTLTLKDGRRLDSDASAVRLAVPKRRNRVTESGDGCVEFSCGSVSMRVDKDGWLETNMDGRRRRCAESSDKGIGLSCGDTDDVVEGRGMVERRRHLSRERHQPVGLTKRPSQLFEMRDPAAVVVARRRCLPCVPARQENSGDVSMSAKAVRGMLVSALERLRGEDSKGEPFVRVTSRRDAGWHPGPLGLPRSVWAR